MTLEEVVRGVATLSPALRCEPASVEWVQVHGCPPARLPVAV